MGKIVSVKSLMWLPFLVLSVVGCSQTFTFIPYVVKQYGNTANGAEFLKVYIADEMDLHGGYYESLKFYNRESFKHLIERRLGSFETLKVRVGQTEVKRGFVTTMSNPYTVVQDSTVADVILRIGISDWDYTDKTSARELIVKKELFGLAGLIGSGKKVVYFGGECRVERADEDRFVIHEFSFGGIANAVKYGARREEMEWARISAVKELVNGHLMQPRPRFTRQK